MKKITVEIPDSLLCEAKEKLCTAREYWSAKCRQAIHPVDIRKMKHRLLCTMIILVLAIIFGCDVAPTTRRYEFREDGSGHLIRLNIGTGEAIIADGEGLRQLFPPEDANPSTILKPKNYRRSLGTRDAIKTPNDLTGGCTTVAA